MWLTGGATITHRRAAATKSPLIVVDGYGLSVAAGEGCGQAGEQEIEEALQFGGAVLAG